MLRGLKSPFLVLLKNMDINNLTTTIEEYLNGTDIFVVAINISHDNLIQVTLDGDTRVSIDDCIDLARHLESTYDRDEEDYELRVGTFGIDIPVQSIRQLNKVVGSELLVKKPEENEQRARLEKIENDNLYITYRIKKGGAKAKALIFKDGDSEVLSYKELEYVKEIICF